MPEMPSRVSHGIQHWLDIGQLNLNVTALAKIGLDGLNDGVSVTFGH